MDEKHHREVTSTLGSKDDQEELTFRGNNSLNEHLDAIARKEKAPGEAFEITVNQEVAFILIAPRFGPCNCDDPECGGHAEDVDPKEITGMALQSYGLTEQEMVALLKRAAVNIMARNPMAAMLDMMGMLND